MRILLLALAVVPFLLKAQPVNRPGVNRIVDPPPEITPSILHRPIRFGAPVPSSYFTDDTILVSISGHVLLSGDCAARMPLYGFQRQVNGEWTEFQPPPLEQMTCSMPSAEWYLQTVALVPSSSLRPVNGQLWEPGVYRAVVLLHRRKPLYGGPFTVVGR